MRRAPEIRQTQTVPEDEGPENRGPAKGNHGDGKSGNTKDENRFSANVVGEATPEHYGHQR
jgi:hypothetical protein